MKVNLSSCVIGGTPILKSRINQYRNMDEKQIKEMKILIVENLIGDKDKRKNK